MFDEEKYDYGCYYPRLIDHEHWQERSYVTEEYVVSSIKSTPFFKKLKNKKSSVSEDNEMRNMLKRIFCKTFKIVSFQKIRNLPNWEQESDVILKEVLLRYKPFGSLRGFHVFKFHDIYEDYIIQVLRNIWAQHLINKRLAPLWLHHYYEPDKGAGFHKIRRHFNLNVKKL